MVVLQLLPHFVRREHYKDVVFLYVSDDPDWGSRHLMPRVKQMDLHLAGDSRPDDADRYR